MPIGTGGLRRHNRADRARAGPDRRLDEGEEMSEFSLDLSEDQLQIQKWVHDFAEDVIRPAAHEWDEREETPWPIIEEAARIGLYSFDFMTQCFFDPGGLMMPIANEELAWGDAGHRPRHLRQRARVWPASSPTGHPSSSASGDRSASGRPRRSRSPRSPCPSPTPAPT